MDDWIYCEEDLPQIDKQYSNKEITIDVECLDITGKKYNNCFYCYDVNKWFKSNGNILKNVIAWRSL